MFVRQCPDYHAQQVSFQTVACSNAHLVRGNSVHRHYLITVKPYGVSKRIRRVLDGTTAASKSHSQSGTLDLGNEKDIADFLLRKKGELGPSSDGYESAASSASSVAGDEGDAIDLADDYVGRNNKKGQKRAVKLDEIGPRMELRLIKVVEGVPGKEGGVLYHEFGAPFWSAAAAPNYTVTVKGKQQVQVWQISLIMYNIQQYRA